MALKELFLESMNCYISHLVGKIIITTFQSNKTAQLASNRLRSLSCGKLNYVNLTAESNLSIHNEPAQLKECFQKNPQENKASYDIGCYTLLIADSRLLLLGRIAQLIIHKIIKPIPVFHHLTPPLPETPAK